ncbi:sensor domain-containing diguanylate cyclase [Rhodococcus aerolatus]
MTQSDTRAAAPVAPGLVPERTFDAACRQVVDYLRAGTPLGMWAVTRVVDGRQVLLTADDEAYGLAAGAEIPFAASPCRVMVAGGGPAVVDDVAADPDYAAVPLAGQVPLGAYVGTPIVWPDGALFGTVCGFDPRARPGELTGLEPLLRLLSLLLSAVLQSDTTATALARELEQVRGEAETDALTGLLNRRGWDRFLADEEARYRRFGDPAAVVVLDLDRLKAVNDAEGHAAGDRYIQRASGALTAAVRPGDVLARLGGDEFGVVAVGADAARAQDLVARLGEALADAGVSGSIGQAPYSVVAGFPGAWAAADEAMYAAKRARRAGQAG